jgi:D-serine deaminase-like pyridoxal phosphate-dependent protein
MRRIAIEPEQDVLARYEQATASLEPPFAVVDLEAFWDNAADLTRRAEGKPIRLASKSVRCRELQHRVLQRNAFRGTLCFTLPEALWLASHGDDDLVVAYPTADRVALAELSRLRAERPGVRIALMVDSVEHLDLIANANASRAQIDVCIDVDAAWWILRGRIRVGAKRSPLHTPAEAASLAREITGRSHFRLVGLMAYETQIAGVGDTPGGHPVKGAAIRVMQSLSRRELASRRAAIVAAVEGVAPLEFVNGGGTGSIENTAAEDAITEVAAGSGLFGPSLFDGYRVFRPRPAAFFVLPVVRRPARKVATVLGGGYLASGAANGTRLPEPHLPRGLRLDRQEGAGEVQTPVLGALADGLAVGDRVYFRHAKAGELCERFDRLYLIEGDHIADEVPTYRGEGQTFL